MSLKDKMQKQIDNAFGTVDLIISFKNGHDIDVTNYKELYQAGKWIKPHGEIIRVQTSLSPANLAALIKKETSIDFDDFTIMNAAGLYIPFS